MVKGIEIFCYKDRMASTLCGLNSWPPLVCLKVRHAISGVAWSILPVDGSTFDIYSSHMPWKGWFLVQGHTQIKQSSKKEKTETIEPTANQASLKSYRPYYCNNFFKPGTFVALAQAIRSQSSNPLHHKSRDSYIHRHRLMDISVTWFMIKWIYD